jgi:hypothetical protein
LKAESKKSLEEILRSHQGLHRGTFRKLLFIRDSRRLEVRERKAITDLKRPKQEGIPQREIISPLEASLDHLWATLFHHLLPMGKGHVVGKTESRRRTTTKKYSYRNR